MNDNKLIAEFMGAEEVKHEKFDGSRFLLPYEGDKNWFLIALNDMEYDTSWDWLIPVVQKIEMECEGVPLQLLNCNLYSEIGEVYQAVVEFINEYNK